MQNFIHLPFTSLLPCYYTPPAKKKEVNEWKPVMDPTYMYFNHNKLAVHLYVYIVFLWNCLWYKLLQCEKNNLNIVLNFSYQTSLNTVYFGNKPDGNESHNRRALSSHSGEFQKMAAHIWHRRNAGIQRNLLWKTKIFYRSFSKSDNIQ